MKKLSAFLVLASLHTACQHSSPATTAKTPPPAPTAAPVLPASSLPSLFKAGDTLTAPMRALAQRHDFGKLW
ncbi:MAG: hypothetical protein EOO62_25260, partial [Hymenobacter sp.]